VLWWVLLVHSVDIRKSQYLPKRVSPGWEFSKSRTWPMPRNWGKSGFTIPQKQNDLQRWVGWRGERGEEYYCTIVLTHSEEYLLK